MSPRRTPGRPHVRSVVPLLNPEPASAAASPSRDGGTRRDSTPATTVTHDVEIRSIAAGGDGVARADGLVIFVPRTAPGDVVRVRATAVPGGHFARGTVEQVLVRSPDRVEAPCIHYMRDRCGGCQLQHLRYEAQLAAKGAIVRDALIHIAHRTVDSVPVVPSALQWRYRQKLTLALRREGSGRWIAGLHRLHAPGDIFPIEDCAITDEQVVGIWRQVMRAANLLPDAPAFRAAVRITDRTAGTTGMSAPEASDRDAPSAAKIAERASGAMGVALIVEGGHRWPKRDAFEKAVPDVSEIWWIPERGGGKPRPPAGLESAGEPRTGASFAQVNPGVARLLHAEVVERVMRHAPNTVVDAYAGTGATALALAERGVRVTAIESDADAAAYCARTLPAGSRSVTARVEDAFGGALPTDVVLVNPPRAGLAAPVTATLESAVPRPRALVYVSCDPATLARDVSRLASWQIASVRAFDMFPQTAHVETVCELVPRDREGAS